MVLLVLLVLRRRPWWWCKLQRVAGVLGGEKMPSTSASTRMGEGSSKTGRAGPEDKDGGASGEGAPSNKSTCMPGRHERAPLTAGDGGRARSAASDTDISPPPGVVKGSTSPPPPRLPRVMDC